MICMRSAIVASACLQGKLDPVREQILLGQGKQYDICRPTTVCGLLCPGCKNPQPACSFSQTWTAALHRAKAAKIGLCYCNACKASALLQDESSTVYDEAGVAEDMLQFLQEFREAHKSYFTAPLFITGESYGGVYLASAGSANCNPVR